MKDVSSSTIMYNVWWRCLQQATHIKTTLTQRYLSVHVDTTLNMIKMGNRIVNIWRFLL